MYLKYNSVLRFFSKNAFLQSQCIKYKLTKEMPDGKIEWINKAKYATTIHAINSGVIKMSKLTVAASVYRGVAGMRVPRSVLEKDKYNVAGGIEVGKASIARSTHHLTRSVRSLVVGSTASRRPRCSRRRTRWCSCSSSPAATAAPPTRSDSASDAQPPWQPHINPHSQLAC